MKIYNGKKLLVLGGMYQNRKIIEMCKKKFIEPYVADYFTLEDAPVKQMVRKHYKIDIFNIEGLVDLCKKEKIDGVISPYLDVAQKPYHELCKRLGFPKYGNDKQVEILTNKEKFKNFCKKNSADIIETYSEEDYYDKKIDFPVIIKPVDSRGSRGQTICYKQNEVENAIKFAKEESINGNIIIEKYYKNANDIQLVYMVINSKPVLVRVEDRYVGSRETGFDKLCIATIDSSRFENLYREKFDEQVKNMIRAIGLENSPVFIQALISDDKVRLYDPGIRLPGDDYDIAYELATGINIPNILIDYALTGEINDEIYIKIKDARIKMATAMILPTLKDSHIKKIDGIEKVKANNSILSFTLLHRENESVKKQLNVKQRLGEFVIAKNNFCELKQEIENLKNTIKVYDDNNNDMITNFFDTELINKYMEK